MSSKQTQQRAFRIEHFLLEMSSEQRQKIDFLFDAFDFLYGKFSICENIDDEKKFLMQVKSEIDVFLTDKNRDFSYDLFEIILAQWMKNDVGYPYLKFDEECCFLKKKVFLPIPDFGLIDIFERDKKRIKEYLSGQKNTYLNLFTLIRMDGVFFVKVVFRKEFLAVESSKKNNSGSNIKKSKTIKLDSPISSSKLSKNKNETSGGIFGYSSDEYDLSPATKKRNAVEDYRMYIQKFEDSKVSLKNKNIRQKVSHNNLNLEEKERLGATKVCSLDDFNAAALEENQLIKKYRGADDGGYSDYAKKFVEQSNKIDMSEVESILEAYRELNDKRSPKVREYLKNCSSVGKFGVPQAKWRNGTYGINSKEPDFFHMFRNFR